jgi:multidrug efflux pump subunit AcrA (membrane-fusion protein)
MNAPAPDLRTLQRSQHPATAVPHPRARWATRLLLPLAILLATASLLAYAARDALGPRVAVRVVAAIPASAQTRVDGHGSSVDTHAATVQAPGWIEPAPYAIGVPALAEGVVREVVVLEGQPVEAGQVVATLVDDDARLGVRLAEANHAAREAEVGRAEAALATARAQVEVERLAAEELRDEVTRSRNLVAAGAVGAGDFRRMEIRLAALEARVVTAERMVLEAQASVTQAQTARRAAAVGVDEAALRLARMEVRSPVSGVVLARLVEPGARLSMGTSDATGHLTGLVLRVYDPAKLQVRVDVPLADGASVGVGSVASVVTEALPDRTFRGVVTRAVHEANIQRNTVQFKVALDEPSPELKPEMLVRVKLQAASATGGHATRDDGRQAGEPSLLLPADVVTPTGEGTGRVWLVDARGPVPVARLRDVRTAPSSRDGFLVVADGLRLTDRVVVEASARGPLHDGTRLEVLGETTAAATPKEEP